MVTVKKEGILINKTHHGFENEGVLNPAVIQDDSGIHMFYRAVSKGNYSSIGYALLKSPLQIAERLEIPVLFPQHEYESQGVEDPRIVKIEDTYYMTYTAYDGVNAMGALAISNNLVDFEKKGIIVPQFTFAEFIHLAGAKGGLNEKYTRYNAHEQITKKGGRKILIWDKNVIFFPRKIKNKFCFLHRIRPDIQITLFSEFKDLTPEFWQNYFLNLQEHILLAPEYPHEISYVGGGCPPIETSEGWILIYHSVHDTVNGYVYSACAALLDLENPEKVLSRLPYPLFQPEYEWELIGEVNNVCFPTGTALVGDDLYIYYGAADEHIACATLKLSELLTELKVNPE